MKIVVILKGVMTGEYATGLKTVRIESSTWALIFGVPPTFVGCSFIGVKTFVRVTYTLAFRGRPNCLDVRPK